MHEATLGEHEDEYDILHTQYRLAADRQKPPL